VPPYRRRGRSASARGKPPKPYRSWLEHGLGTGALKDMAYEPFTIPYQIETSYKPDFVNEEKKIIFEAKGRFSDSAEASKYVHFRRCQPDWELIFIFERPECPMPNTRKRKDGSRYTHRMWAEKNNFLWCSPTTIRSEWL